jgi:alpha-methylacyl-CoA racemase
VSDARDESLPLRGVRVVEIAGLGPLPLCAMLLADLGASVIRIDQPRSSEKGVGVDTSRSMLHRARSSTVIDLKSESGRTALRAMLAVADILLEGMKPGAMERLGFGPTECRAINPRLIFGRLSGWGRDGDLASEAGHDINYAAVAGLLGLIGRAGELPAPPLALGADFPGGFLLALGLVAALYRRKVTGEGCIVDQSLASAAGMVAAVFRGLAATGRWPGRRGENVLDGGAPYYRVYETADGKMLAVGALEPKFYERLVDGLGLTGTLPNRNDRANWPTIGKTIADTFRTRNRDEWEALFRGTDACVTPVLDLDEAVAYGVPPVSTLYGYAQTAPQPWFAPLGEKAAAPLQLAEAPAVADTLADWGLRPSIVLTDHTAPSPTTSSKSQKH